MNKQKHPREWYWNEHRFQTNFKNFLNKNNILNYKTHGGAFKNEKGNSYQLNSGWSDLIVAVNHRVLFIELKRRNGLKREIRQSQYDFFENMERLGMADNCFVFFADEWTDFKNNYKETNDLFLSLVSSTIQWSKNKQLISVKIEK